MSKLAVFLAVPALAGAGALLVMNLQMRSELDELRAQLDATRPAKAAAASAVTAVERTPPRRPESDTRVRALEERLVTLETRVLEVEPHATAAPAAPATPDAGAADVAPSATSPEFRRAVESVLEAREAERRAERVERMVDGRTRQLLREVPDLTDQQRESVHAALAQQFAAREAARDEDLEPQLAQERFDEQREAFTRTLESILSANQMDVVRPRLEVGRRMAGAGLENTGRRGEDGTPRRPRGGGAGFRGR